MEDDHLVAHHRRHGDITLTPAEQDAFAGDSWFFSNVTFERDADALTGMRVSNGRVRDFDFVQQE